MPETDTYVGQDYRPGMQVFEPGPAVPRHCCPELHSGKRLVMAG